MKVTLKPGLWLMLAVVFVVTLGATTAIWSFLRGQETRRAQTLLVSASGSLQDRVQAELDQELSAIQRMAAKWQIRPDMARTEWEYDVRHILEEHPSLLSVAWIQNPHFDDPQASTAEIVRDWRINWSLPTIYDPAVTKIHSLVTENRIELLNAVVGERRARVSDPVSVADRGKAFAFYVPAVVDGRLKGALVGVFHLQVMMDSVFDRLLATDYSIRLMDGYEPIYIRGEGKSKPEDWEHQGTLNVFSAVYKLRLWPSPEVQKANERLADLILLGGAGVAVLLTLLVYFAARRPASKPAILIPDAAEHRRKIEERLRIWEATIGSLDDAIFVAEAERVMGAGPIILFANEALTRLTGYEVSELVGKSPKSLFSPELLSSEIREDSRISVWHKASVAVDVEMRARPILDASQNVTHWIVSLKRVQEAKLQLVPPPSTLLDKLVADAPLPVQLFDLTGEVTHWNALAETTTGLLAEEIIGHATPLGVEFPTPGFWTRQDLHITHKNGERLDLAVWTAPLRNVDGTRSTRFMSLMADLTREHVEQEKLAEREASFRALVENATDILAILDLDSTVQYINPAVKALLGLDATEVIGTPAAELLQKASGIESTIRPIEGKPLLMLTARHTRTSAPATSLLDALGDAVLTYDTEHRVTWMNRAAEDLYGFKADDARGKTLTEIQPDWLQVPSREQVFAELDLAGSWKGEISNFTPNGREIVQDVSIAITRDENQVPTGAVAIHRDITAKKSAIDALETEDKTRTLQALGTSEGLWDWNLRTDEVYFSPRWKEMLGYDDDDITGDLGEWYMLVHPDDLPLLRNRVAAYLKGQAGHLEIEYRSRTRAGQYRWMMTRAMAMRDASGTATRLVGLQTDIHDQKQRDEQLLFEAFHDSLTGLANRALFLDRLNGELAHPGAEFAVVFFDLKQFAAINQAIGTRGGDKALAEAGQRIAACLPPGSVVARHGSDEFVALIHDGNPENLEALLALIRSRLARPFAFGGKEVRFEVSAGVALSKQGAFVDGEAMLQAASQAMAVTREPQPAAAERFDPEQFRVFYHPIVALDTGEIYGMEALIRWQHPELGLLTPGDFLPAAEASGQILEIDRWMLAQACAKAVELNERFHRLALTVNLSKRHFEDAQNAAALEAIIHASGLDPALLRIEINQAALVEAPEYTSLDVAGALEAGAVKLSPALVRGLASRRNFDQAQAIIREARKQNLKVVAEGVENLEQVAILRELQCHLAQGFYFTKPASEADTERLLARGPRW